MATKNPSKRSLANGYVSKGGYDAFDDQDNYKTMPNYMTSDPKPLHVRVHVNNNTNDKGKDMVIVPKIYKTFDRLLEDVTEKLKPPFGAVRRLYTSRGRNKIQNVNELNDGSIYVATGPEHYKRHNYKDIPDRRPLRQKGRYKKIDIDRVYKLVDHALDENYRKKSAECFRLNQQRKGLLLLISVNGKNLEGAHHLSISYHLKNDLDRIKTSIQENLGLRMISRLYKVINYGGRLENFSEITDANDLHRFDHVLAVQIGQKLDVKYYQPERLKDFHMKTSPRSEPIPTPRNLSVFQKYKKLPSIGSSKQSEANTSSPFSNPPGSQGGRKARKSRGAKEVNYDRDDGVYRAKKQNNAYGAHQEEIHTKEKTTPIPAGTELNKQPSKETKQNADNASQTKNKAEVKKGGKSSKDLNKVSVLPPIVDKDTEKVKKGDVKEIKEGHVKETVEKYEGKAGEGKGEDNLFVDEKEVTPMDLKTDDVIEMSERDVSPVELQSNEVEVNKPPLSTTPPQGKISQGSRKVQERVDEDAGMHRIDEFDDDSFNRFDQNASGAVTKDPWSSTPASRDEARREREQREYEAAAKIQAGVRGYQARKDYGRKKAAKREQDDERRWQEDEARRLEEEARQREDDMRRQEEEARDREMMAQRKQMDEDEAATRIQASFKGHRARKDFRAKKQQVCESRDKQSEKIKEAEAATKIQSSFKGYKVRKEYNRKKQLKETDINDNEKKDLPDEDRNVKDLDKESLKEAKMTQDEAAVAIQAGYKGYKTRKEYAQKKAQKEQSEVENKTDKDKREHAAASRIQANVRGYKVRKEYANKKKKKGEEEEHKAATRIQASFKGYQARKQISKKEEPQLPDQAPSPKRDDEEELNKAATKIQSGFKGYKARKEYKSKVIDEHIVETDFAQLPDSAFSRSSVKKGQFIQGSRGDMASKIQSAFRVYHAKKVLEKGGGVSFDDINRNREADEKIIAAYKGFRTRQIEKENFQKNNAAALKIQALYKGYKVRKTKHYHIRVVNLLHAAVRGYVTRKLNNVRVASNIKVTSVINGEHYASIIQALCKGFLTRFTVRKMKERHRTKSNSANSSQGPTISSVTDESEGEISYWKDTNIKMYSDKTLRKAAARIQSVIYAYRTRKIYNELRSKRIESGKSEEISHSVEVVNAVPKIQACFKGYLERKSKRNNKVVKDKGEKAGVNYETRKGEQDKVECREEIGMSESESIERKEEENNNGTQNDAESSFRIEEQSSPRPTSAKSVSSNFVRQLSDRSLRKRPKSGRPSSGRPVSGQTRSPSRHGSLRGSSGKMKSQSSECIGDDDTRNESQLIKENLHTPTTYTENVDTEITNRAKETIRSSTQLSGTANSDVSESILSFSDIDKEQRRGSARSYSTWKSSEKLKNSGNEIEREGESLREIEDDAGELSSIERNVNAVSQLQAAFRAYKLRREISELMSGGGELMDIKTIDRAVSALRKDFRLRSAKVRRLGSCQFDKEKPANWGQNWWENNEDEYSTTTVDMQEQDNERDDSLKDSKNDIDTKAVNLSERSESISKITAAVKGYEVRKCDKERRQNDSKEKIEAAYRGYRTRVTEIKINSRSSSRRSDGSKTGKVKSAGSRTSANSERTVFHVQMHSDIINERCTRLQAAFAGYLTRKVFISLTKLVEQNEQSDHDTSAHQLERMGSLSETDDFKLRHKTIAKIQATYESYRIAHESKKGSRESLKGTASPNTLNRYMVLPPIQQDVQLIHDHSCRPKSAITHVKIIEVPEGKSKTQPDLYKRYGHTSDTKALTKIELSIKRKLAATVVQAHSKAYLTRRKIKVLKTKQNFEQTRRATEESSEKKTSASVDRKTPVSRSSKTNKICFKTDKNNENKDARDQQNRKKEDKTMTDMVRVRTASIKLEAERRKVIAEKIRLNQQTDAKELTTKTETAKAEEDTVKRSDSPESLTPIHSGRLLKTEKPYQANDLVLREERAAVQIQKVYRGHRVRQELGQKTETREKLDKEYSVWKTKRQDAAVSIQSAWRGYSVRKNPVEGETSSEAKKEETKDDFSHLDDDRGLVVINIGRTKSEIERANRTYKNASMIQMIFRACKIRRKLAIKGAKRRLDKNKAASKIQALYKAYWTRHKLKESVSATRIQSVFKAYLARDNMQERMRVKEEQRQKAASLLQAAYLSFRKRRENEALKKERRMNQAVQDIQSAGKGFIVRWENSRKRESNQMRAALQIQSAFKGQRERKKMKIWKEAVVKIVAGFKSYKARQVIQALKDKLERERVAATRLQAAYRAYLVRNSNKQYKEKMARQDKAATKIQSSFRGREARTCYRIQKENMQRKRQAAALKIQSVYRGYQGRKVARSEIMMKKRETAALKIQSVYRGHQGREIARRERHIVEIHSIAEASMNLILDRTFDYVGRRIDSSERIQATVKGYNTRRQMTCKLTDEAKLRMRCASVIQGAFRATMDRKRTDRKSQRDISATIIQSVFRAKDIRQKQDEKKLLELMNDSAKKIQSLFRGYRTRTEIQKEREMIASLEPPPTALISARTRSGKLLSISMDEVLMKNSRAIILFHRKATELQEAFRAYITRKEMKDRFLRKSIVVKKTPRRVLSVTKRLTKEDKAAILIQKTFRGFWNRKVYRNAMANRKKLRNNAATYLQATVKSYRVRLEESGREIRLKKEGMSEVWRQKQEAANIISFAYRSYQHRKAKRALRVEM